jgi:hypothetical protein
MRARAAVETPARVRTFSACRPGTNIESASARATVGRAASWRRFASAASIDRASATT